MEVDDSEPPVETAVRDETLHIHLGPNGQPLSFEWVRYDYTTMSCPPFEGGIQGGCREPSSGNKPSSVNGQLATATLLSDTYYYHYDIHGNVIKVTDSSATTKIAYEYDVLGEITSVSNPDGITNPFTFRGATQATYDEGLELYFGGGYYRADLGTTLSSSGVASNPTSGQSIAKVNTSSSNQNPIKLNGSGQWKYVKGADNWLSVINMLYGYIGPIWEYIVQEIVDFKEDAFDVDSFFWVTGVKVNCQGMADLINKQGNEALKERKDGKKKKIYRGTKLSRNAWMNGWIRSISDQWIKANSYFIASREDAFEFATKIARTYFHKGAVIFKGHDDRSYGELVAIIFDLQCYFDSVYGANAYKDPRRRKQFLTYLIDCFKILGIPIIDIFRFVSAFIETYGPIDDDEPLIKIKRAEGDFSGDLDDYPDADVKFVKGDSPIWKMYGKSRPPPDFWERYDHLGIRAPDMPPIKDPTVLPPWLPPPVNWKPGNGKPGSPGNPYPPDVSPGPVPRPPSLPSFW